MEITFLGTSSAVHTEYRNHPGICLKAFGETILFDCGESTQKQLLYAKISPMKVSKIFITHYHGDHILGLPGLIQSLNFRGREKPLDIYGPYGLLKIKEGIEKLSGDELRFEINYNEIDEGTIVECEEYVIKACKVRHNTPSLAYSIEEKKKPRFLREKAIELGIPEGPAFGKLHRGESIELNGKIIKPEEVLGKPRKGRKVTYSGDTSLCEEMVMFARDSTILIHEATYLTEDRARALENAHSTSQDAAVIARDSNSKKLLLTHFSPRYDDENQILEEAKEIFENVELAKDLMKVEIK